VSGTDIDNQLVLLLSSATHPHNVISCPWLIQRRNVLLCYFAFLFVYRWLYQCGALPILLCTILCILQPLPLYPIPRPTIISAWYYR